MNLCTGPQANLTCGEHRTTFGICLPLMVGYLDLPQIIRHKRLSFDLQSHLDDPKPQFLTQLLSHPFLCHDTYLPSNPHHKGPYPMGLFLLKEEEYCLPITYPQHCNAFSAFLRESKFLVSNLFLSSYEVQSTRRISLLLFQVKLFDLKTSSIILERQFSLKEFAVTIVSL